MIDTKTWCGEKIEVAKILAKRLDEIEINTPLTKKVNKFINKFHLRMKAIDELEKTERKYYMHLMLDDSKKNIKEGFNGDVQSLLLNLIHALWSNRIKNI